MHALYTDTKHSLLYIKHKKTKTLLLAFKSF